MVHNILRILFTAKFHVLPYSGGNDSSFPEYNYSVCRSRALVNTNREDISCPIFCIKYQGFAQSCF